jgi:hypothetical protein
MSQETDKIYNNDNIGIEYGRCYLSDGSSNEGSNGGVGDAHTSRGCLVAYQEFNSHSALCSTFSDLESGSVPLLDDFIEQIHLDRATQENVGATEQVCFGMVSFRPSPSTAHCVF